VSRLRRTAARPTAIGEGLVVRGPLSIRNRGELLIGDSVVLESEPVRSHLVTGPGARIRIGNGVRIGHAAAISCASRVEIGDDVAIGDYVMIMDSDFHVAGDADATATPVPVVIEPGAVLGHRVVVLPGARIGAGATVRSGSVVSGVIAPGSTVAGNPALPVGGRPSAVEAADRSVGEIVAQVFDLAEPAGPALGPSDVPAWDSLGALRLLLEVETAYGVLIDEQRMAGVSSVADLERLVAASRRPVTEPV
jgi:acetyltransferase-like isoleucine patch superfamily enzyme/acyl carrier protein